MPTPHHSVFYRLDALPAAQPTASILKATEIHKKYKLKPIPTKTHKNTN